MRGRVWVLTVVVLLAGCSSGGGGRVATRFADVAAESTTTTALDVTATTEPEVGPVTTLAPGATTTTARPTSATTAAPAPTTTAPGSPATTSASAVATTTTAAVATTTTAPLEKVSPLTAVGSCDQPGTAALGIQALVVAVDVPKLRADLAAQGYAMPEAFQFRDYRGTAVSPAPERDLSVAQDKLNQCAADSGGTARLTLRRVAGESGSQVFAELVKAQMDGPKFRNYGGADIT